MGKFFEMLLKIDFKTAGWKTYLGLALVVLSLVLRHLQVLDQVQSDQLTVLGVGIATIGRAAVNNRAEIEAKTPPSNEVK